MNSALLITLLSALVATSTASKMTKDLIKEWDVELSGSLEGLSKRQLLVLLRMRAKQRKSEIYGTGFGSGLGPDTEPDRELGSGFSETEQMEESAGIYVSDLGLGLATDTEPDSELSSGYGSGFGSGSDSGFSDTEQTLVVELEESAAEDEGSGGKDDESFTEDEGSGAEDDESLAEDEGSGGEDDESLAEDEGSGAEDDESLAEDEGSGGEDDESLAEDEGSGAQDDESLAEDEGSGGEDEESGSSSEVNEEYIWRPSQTSVVEDSTEPFAERVLDFVADWEDHHEFISDVGETSSEDLSTTTTSSTTELSLDLTKSGYTMEEIVSHQTDKVYEDLGWNEYQLTSFGFQIPLAVAIGVPVTVTILVVALVCVICVCRRGSRSYSQHNKQFGDKENLLNEEKECQNV